MNLRDIEPYVPITYRQADYWRRKGYLGEECQNPGSGTGRGDLTPSCLRRLLILSAASCAGIKFADVVKALDLHGNDKLLAANDELELTMPHGLFLRFELANVPGWMEAVRDAA